MGFTLDYKDTLESGLIPEGVYEVIVREAKEDVTKGGVQHISIELVVRNDIKQNYQNSHIWSKMWKRKDNGQYNMRMINTIGKALGLTDGKYYENLNSLLHDFDGKVCQVRIKHEEYNNYTNANVSSWRASSFPVCNHVWNTNKDGAYVPGLGQEIAFNDSDLPF